MDVVLDVVKYILKVYLKSQSINRQYSLFANDAENGNGTGIEYTELYPVVVNPTKYGCLFVCF
uniref:Uncharacterized protein n=1 Tax=Octopus bimaculoides TaxID=37653 RepID=A0A0L8ICJ4_OCTBM